MNLPDRKGETPLLRACQLPQSDVNVSIVDLLLKKDGIDPTNATRNYGWTPFGCGCYLHLLNELRNISMHLDDHDVAN